MPNYKEDTMYGYNHYIRIDANNIVIHRFSDAFEQPQDGDICVATNAGRHYNDPITDGQGNFIYKWDGIKMVDRTSDLDYLLPIAKAKKLAELQQAMVDAIEQPFQSSALGSTRTYSYSSKSVNGLPSPQENFRGKALQLSMDPSIATVSWYTLENGFEPHTREQFLQVLADGGTHQESAQVRYYQLEPQVNAATTVVDVDAIAW
jgi:hypothetical protein